MGIFRRDEPAPELPSYSKARTRVARLSVPDIIEGADVALSDGGRALKRWQQGEEEGLYEFGICLEVLTAIKEELDTRHGL